MRENERGGDRKVVGSRVSDDPWRDNEIARRRKIQEAAKQPLGVNLAETLVLSEFVIQLAESMRRPR